jgi:citrate lyase subunit beta/citryl-CoA lyase
VELANEIFTPPVAEVEKAKRILVALQEAAALGKGAAALDGRLIDAASEKMANNVVRAAEAIAAKTK